ncbi:hypothetical protein Moror_9662 [Moniliophthora roreri MCA 2997]|nr:hypothetical protein Moror_9662 [Moniliophthora roreri MCA 2997]
MITTLLVQITKPVENKQVFCVQGGSYFDFNHAFGKEIYKNLLSFLEAGVIMPNEVKDLPGGACWYPGWLQNGNVYGKKLIVHPQHTP